MRVGGFGGGHSSAQCCAAAVALCPVQLCLSAPFLLFCTQQLPALCPTLGVCAPWTCGWTEPPLLVDPTPAPSYQRQQQEWAGEYGWQKCPLLVRWSRVVGKLPSFGLSWTSGGNPSS